MPVFGRVLFRTPASAGFFATCLLSLSLVSGFGVSLAGAQETASSADLAAQPLVRGVVDDTMRVTLAGNVYPLAQTRYDMGRVADSFAVDRLYLLLKRSPAQEAALRLFLQDAHTAGTASFHQWLTPAQFGQRFGAADSDVEAVTAWLESHGLRVGQVHAGRIAVEFSGNAAQVEAAFRTEIHRYSLRGRTFYANSVDPQIPAAFQNLVAGISPMHSTLPAPLIKVAGKTSFNRKTHEAKPDWTYPESNGGLVFEMSPTDFAVQYDLGPVYTAGTTGTGQAIGILSESNIDLSLVAAYRQLFGLPTKLPTVVIDGVDPGENEDAAEAYLDVESAGSVAPMANVYLYTSGGTVLSDPLLSSGLRALQDNQVSVISLSYDECEAALGASGNAAWAQLWQEAAAQGITAFVAAGDGGSAGCDDFDDEAYAIGGVAVNGMGSTPYNVSVGGTDFFYSGYAAGGTTLNNQIKAYWNFSTSAAPVTSLVKAAPEQVWNDSVGLNAASNGVYDFSNSNILAGGGGPSSFALYPNTGAPTGYLKPIWQKGTGVPIDKVRDVPDVALFAASGSNYIYYPICASQGDCVNVEPGGAVEITSVGGTSASAPAMAAIQALVNQATHSRQGQADYVYYALFNKTLTAKPFKDVTLGTNSVPCVEYSTNCVLASSGPAKGFYVENGYAASTGYDRASGLGSVDVANLIKSWASATFRPSTATLSITPAAFAHGTTVSAKVTVAPATGTGVPVGVVGLDSNDPQAYANSLAGFTLKNGTVTGSVNDLPGGTYQVTANYSGDSIFGASVSAPVTVTVTPEADTLNTSGWVVNPLDYFLYPLQAGMAIPYGSQVLVDAEPLGVHGAGAALGLPTGATGVVSFTDVVGTTSKLTSTALNSQGVAEWAPSILGVGAHKVSAKYAGDTSYLASAAPSAASMTVFRGNTFLTATPFASSVVAGGRVTVDVILTPAYQPIVGVLPTGVVTVRLGAQALVATMKSWASGTGGAAGLGRIGTQEGVVSFTGVPAGLLPLSATYGGDPNWYGASNTWGTVTSFDTRPAPAVSLSAATVSYTPSQVVTMTGTVSVAAGKPLPTGDLYFTWEGGQSSLDYAMARGVNSASYTLTLPASLLAPGSNLFVASFKGDANYSAQSSSPLVVTLVSGDFSLTTPTQAVAVKIGGAVSGSGSGTGSVLISPLLAYTGTVAITCAAPTGISCIPAAASLKVGSGVVDTLLLKAASTVTAGSYPVAVTVAGGGRVHTAQILVAAH